MIAGQTALGRVGIPEDIGPFIAALLSESGRWVNGQRIEVSGDMRCDDYERESRDLKTMKTFLSIGSGPGMGYATAERFAREGFQIVLSARHPGRTQELANRLRTKGYRVDIRTVDAADPESIAALINEVQREFGPIDVLHYNAASIRRQQLGTAPSNLQPRSGS